MSEIVNEAVIKVTADASGVEAGLKKVSEHTAGVAASLQRVDETAKKTGRTLENLGSGPGLRTMGDGADQAAGQVDRSTKSLIDSIKRATASMSAGTKGSTEYFQALANSRGINVSALKPYLDQLDDVTRKTALAAESQKRLDDSTRFLADLATRSNTIGKTASQLMEMRAAELGVTDAARPMIEQMRAAEASAGGVESKFGKAKVALLAIGAAALAGVGMFGSMIMSAADAADQLGDLSKSTGVAVEDLAGLKLAAEQSGGDLEGIADSLNKLSLNITKDGAKFRELGITAKEPLEAFKQLADLFASIQDPQTRAALGAATLGKSWAAAAPLLAEGGERIGEMIEKGKQLSGMTAEMVAQSDQFNDNLAEMKTAFAGFKTQVASDVLPGLNSMIGAVHQAYTESGKLAALWAAMGAAGTFVFTNEFSSAQVKIKDLKEDLKGFEDKLALSKLGIGAGALTRMLLGEDDTYLENKIRSVKEQIKALQSQANPPTPFVDEFGDKFMSSVAAYGVNRALGDKTEEERNAREHEAAIKAEASSYASLTSAIRERISATGREAAGLAPLTESERLRVALTDMMADAKRRLLPIHEADYRARIKQLSANEAVIASNKRLLESEAREMKGKIAADVELRSIADQVKAQEQSNEQIGLAGVALAALQAARLEDAAAQKIQSAAALEAIQPNNAVAETYREQAAELRKLAAAKLGGATKQNEMDEVKKAADEQKRMWDSIDRTAHDTFVSIFDSGKSTFDRLTDTLKNGLYDMLYQMTIKKWIVNVGASMGLTGTASVAQAAASAAGSGSNMLGSGLSLASIGSSLAAGGGLASQLGTGFVGSVYGGMTGAGVGSGLTSSAGLALGQGLGTMGTALMAAAPYLLAVGAAVAIWKKLDTSGTYHAGGAASATSAGVSVVSAGSLNMERIQTNAATQTMVGQLAQGVVGILDSTALAFGKTAGYQAATAFADDTSKDGAWGSLVISKMGQSIVNWQDTRGGGKWSQKTFADGEKGQDQYLAALTSSVRTALDSIGLPAWAKTMLSGVASDASLEDLAKVVQQINQTQQALGAMRSQLTGFASLSETAVSALMAASGGIDKLFASASSYYDAFYTEAEKNRTVNEQIAKQLAAVNLQMPATKEGFRALVEAQMRLGDQGAESVSVLLGVGAAFAQLHPDVAAATKDLSSYRSALTDAYNAESEAVKQTISRMGSLETSMRNLGKSALLGGLSPLSPAQKYAEARSQYDAVAAAARGGDEKAQDRYQEVYTAFLEASRLVNASSYGYQQDFSYAQAMTEEVASWAGEQINVGQAQLDMLKSQVSGIIDINTSVLSVRDALLQYHEAMGKNAMPLTAVAPPVNTPIPYSSYGAGNTTALVDEIKGLRADNAQLRAEMSGLRADQRQQTGEVIQAQYGSADESARRISGSVKAASYSEPRVYPE
jgi:hypothetical protein